MSYRERISKGEGLCFQSIRLCPVRIMMKQKRLMIF